MDLWGILTRFTCRIKLHKLGLMLILIMVFQQNHFGHHPRRIHAAAEQPSRWLHKSCNSITDDKDLVSSDSFIQDLPSPNQTALLYHFSYLYLRDFPELERVIRERAVETQQLSGKFEALLVKCAGTSENLVTSLLPNLKVAAEKNKPELAQKHLDKAKGWISDIMMDAKEIVKRYHEHNRDVTATTNDIITKQQQQTSEMEKLQKIIDGQKEKRLSISEKIEDNEKKIEEKNRDIQRIISSRGFVFSILGSLFGLEEVQIRYLRADLSKIPEEQKRLREEELDIKNQLFENQQKLPKLHKKEGQMASVTSLDEVQKYLSKIQSILVRLQKFWEKVGSLLDTMKKRTFTGEMWIEDLTDMKEEFLKSIDAAEEGWTKFGISCKKAYHIFSVQANEAYSFLEINPSSLSEEEWQKEYESVKRRLEIK